MKSYAKIVLVLLPLMVTQQLSATPRPRYSIGGTSLGMRLGWVGGPNGLTVRTVVGRGAAFEFVAGYNHKYGRHADIPDLKKGNSFLSASFAPFFLMSEGNLGVALTADFGARLNYHHYRSFGVSEWGGGSKITPELIGGLGMQVEFSETVQIFGDCHLKYFNEPHGFYVPGLEAGLGMRVALN